MALEAALAASAGERRIDGDAPAVERTALDDARELVADHERLREARVADAALLVPVQVGAAEPDRLDAHEALPRAGRLHRLLRNAHVTDAVHTSDRAERSHRLDGSGPNANGAARRPPRRVSSVAVRQRLARIRTVADASRSVPAASRVSMLTFTCRPFLLRFSVR